MKSLFKKTAKSKHTHPKLISALSKLHSRTNEYGKFKWKVRASSLPLCSRFYGLYLVLNGILKIDFIDVNKFILDISAEAGTNVHTVYQRWMSRAGVLFGNYTCKFCHVTHYHRVGPVLCMACGSECVYDEIEVLDSLTGYTGHVDALIPVDARNLRKGFFLGDIKTGKKEDVEPEDNINGATGLAIEFYNRVWRKWMWQISTYAFWLSQQTIEIYEDGTPVEIPLRIVGCAIIVVNRNQPWRNRLIFTEDYDMDKYKAVAEDIHYVEHKVRRFVKSRNAIHIEELEKKCKSVEDGIECPLFAHCFSDTMNEDLEDMLEKSKFGKENRLLREGANHSAHLVGSIDPLIEVLRNAFKQS